MTALMMAEVSTSETSVYIKKHHGALSQKADIFKTKHSSVLTILPVTLLLQIRDKCSVLDDNKTKVHHA
jgi:hypothetical protein